MVDVVIIGAGAAGLLCAAEASRRGRGVVVLEHSNEPGRKILISGGGRANFTNIGATPANFLSNNPHFHKSALARYTPRHFLSLFKKHKIPWHEKKLGQLFCDNSARDLLDMLLVEASASQIVLNCQVRNIRRTTHFIIETSKATYEAQALVIATGGLSIPKIGATDFGYRVARQFGLKVVPCRPALVPLTFDSKDAAAWEGLSGVATDVRAQAGSTAFEEKMLFTHRGLSGPAILQISSYWQPHSPIRLDLVPGINIEQIWKQAKAAADRTELKTILAAHVPKRLADRWMDLYSPSRPALQAPLKQITTAASKLHHFEITPEGTEGYAKAEVTAGGIDTNDLDSKTMQAKNVPGLFFVGEVMDVTGQLGGYNFQWAWSSAFAAATAL